jgi:hypothetical protein
LTKLLTLAWQPGKVVLVDLPSGDYRVLVEDAGDHPDGIACDGRTVYWTTMGAGVPADNPEGADYTARNGGLHAIDLDGTNRRDVIPQGGTTTGKQLVLDSGGNLFWGNREGFSLDTVRTDGSGQRDLVRRDGSQGQRDWIVGVAVDEDNGYLYWSQKGSYEGGDGRIFRAGLEIPAGQTAENRTDIETLWDGLPAPIDLELMNGHLFWTDRGHQPGGNSLNRAPIPAPGAKGEAPEILADGFEEAIGLAVDLTEHLAYVSDLSGKIWVVPAPDNTQVQRHALVSPGIPLTGLTLLEG